MAKMLPGHLFLLLYLSLIFLFVSRGVSTSKSPSSSSSVLKVFGSKTQGGSGNKGVSSDEYITDEEDGKGSTQKPKNKSKNLFTNPFKRSSSKTKKDSPVPPLTSDDEDFLIESELGHYHEILSHMQTLLLGAAAVTFICILIYSIYYVNMIRKIYSKDRVTK